MTNTAPQATWNRPWNFADVEKARAGGAFTPSRVAERAYERKLKNVAGQVQTILATTADPLQAEKLLREYAAIVEPWARAAAANMMTAAVKKNDQTWQNQAGRMGLEMRRMMASSGIGQVVRDRIGENVRLIKSLALDSADNIRDIVQEAMVAGSRAEDLAKRIEGVGEVSASRARTIARTEVSKAGTALTQARAQSFGSEGYIWRTARDGDTRDSHRAMEGKYVRWDSPPTIDGMTGHAGEFPNCRCYPEPVVPKGEKDGGVYKPPLPTQAQERNAGEQKNLSQWERLETSRTVRHAPGQALANVDKAVFDMAKLTSYSMNAAHPSGKHKARVWKAALGLEKDQAPLIEKQIMAWLAHLPAAPQNQADAHGQRFRVTVPVTGMNGKTVDVVTGWIYEKNKRAGTISTTPRLSTIYVAGTERKTP